MTFAPLLLHFSQMCRQMVRISTHPVCWWRKSNVLQLGVRAGTEEPKNLGVGVFVGVGVGGGGGGGCDSPAVMSSMAPGEPIVQVGHGGGDGRSESSCNALRRRCVCELTSWQLNEEEVGGGPAVNASQERERKRERNNNSQSTSVNF